MQPAHRLTAAQSQTAHEALVVVVRWSVIVTFVGGCVLVAVVSLVINLYWRSGVVPQDVLLRPSPALRLVA